MCIYVCIFIFIFIQPQLVAATYGHSPYTHALGENSPFGHPHSDMYVYTCKQHELLGHPRAADLLKKKTKSK